MSTPSLRDSHHKMLARNGKNESRELYGGVPLAVPIRTWRLCGLVQMSVEDYVEMGQTEGEDAEGGR